MSSIELELRRDLEGASRELHAAKARLETLGADQRRLRIQVEEQRYLLVQCMRLFQAQGTEVSVRMAKQIETFLEQ